MKSGFKSPVLVSGPVLAKALRVSHTAVYKAAKEGRIPREPDGSFDLAQCRAAWTANAPHAKPVGVEQESPSGSLTAFRAELEREKVIERRRKNALAAGEYISRAEVNEFISGMFVAVRDELLKIGPELADRLSGETPARIERMIEDRITRALAHFREVTARQVAA